MEVRNPNEHAEDEMLPPPVGTFQTREELLKYVRDFALTQGYMVSIKDSSKNRYVTIACDRGGVYRKRLKTGENMRQRKVPSRLTNCPFEVVGKKDDDLWTLTIKHGEHNHEPSKNMSDHPSCRRFTEEEILLIREMTAAGKRPRQILKALRQSNPSLISDSRNVYNVKAKIRREMVSGKKMESPSTSSGAVNMNGLMEVGEPSERMVLNGVVMGESICQAYLESDAVKETRTLASELCQHFYTLGWVSGTGGSISIKVQDNSIPKSSQLIVMSPSGVQKERMVPEDFYVLSSDGYILLTPPLKPCPHNQPKCTDCAPLFLKVYEICNAGAVIHSHGMESCLVTMIHPFSKEFRITHMEMIKGIQGHGYHDQLVVPIIENTAREGELLESLTEAIRAYPKTTAVLVRNHGVFIWGDSWIAAKTQAECYHYLFDAAIKLHQLGLDWSTPSHGSVRNINGTCGCGGNMSRGLKAGALDIDYVIEPSQCILLDIEGTTTPLSFITGVLFPYAKNNLVKHLVASYDSEETQHDISLLRSQIQRDLEQGIVGALPIAPDYMGKEMVIDTLAANMEAMIQADRKVTALKQLQGHILRTGFQNNELTGVVFDDVREALESWHALGIKVYMYSSGSREAQQLLFANSNYGDLRKYLCGFFDTTIGDKNDTQSYAEILRTVGVDTPADMLFVTDILQDAEAARAAGLEVMISIRPGNGPLPENHGFRTIESLLEI
ncbi:probable bifunctional methylthioribulose-1-phosphate dehydratase/enolase-phosphatase E1 2 isoform X2 [Actinidia eriantha]|uniref:probable bifunctional methylthioribulose-1-phosphate dehydratase/enolase-phosphatase E1 2 isoform X2 n=1 Tax=Actinidia eriantha TaxID=165200 RepID=UPI00258A0C6A|nr:probable bifunctional methylthioribulose-1-phosphate dehydratase/enolase-phosphatase E1 2 isoform X2 [Actinidia eriantha]